jgi:hypothetical protein
MDVALGKLTGENPGFRQQEIKTKVEFNANTTVEFVESSF